MAVHTNAEGLDLPITGAPEQTVYDDGKPIRSVAVLADDYPGMKPRMMVAVGDTVARGTPLFEDRKNPGVLIPSPGSGVVAAIHRGEKRRLISVVITLCEAECKGATDIPQVPLEGRKEAAEGDAKALRTLLVASGLWTAIRKRPFDKVPAVDSSCDALFISASDSEPLAAAPEVVLKDKAEAFAAGVAALATLTHGPVFVCAASGSGIEASGRAEMQYFHGPHPSGSVGWQIHTLAPVSRTRNAWHVGYQDVVAIGRLLQTGKLDVSRVVSVAGPAAAKPRLVTSRIGAALGDLLCDEVAKSGEGTTRVISGSVLSGRQAQGDEEGFLGRFHRQVSLVAEDDTRKFLGWLAPGADTFSITGAFLSKWMPKKKFAFSTTTHGEKRPMVPIGLYEKLMPHDILPTFLLRALATEDLELAEQLGALELVEEDLSLCAFVCPGKSDWSGLLRQTLTQIEKEG